MAIPCRRLFAGRPMPDLQLPPTRLAEPNGRMLTMVGGDSR